MDALAEDRPIAVAVLFEAQGEANVTSAALDRVLATTLPVPDPVPPAVVLPPLREIEPPGRLDGTTLVVRGLGTAALARHDAVVVVARSGDDDGAFVVPIAALKAEPVSGIDPALGLVEISGALEAASLPAPLTVDWARALTAGQLALGHELVGSGRAMLELARTHALERIQFGRPISSFQAVRHRLAETLVALDAAAALLSAVWDDPSPQSAAMAKGLAGRSARTAARHCQQVLAGIGFTVEHPFHRFFFRTVVHDQLLGAGDALTRQLGGDVLATGRFPASFPL
jgi:alkylation response protein AidB-like acyl-CoA dehydrogenase